MIRFIISVLLAAQIPLPASQTGTATGTVRAISGAPAAGVRVAALALTATTGLAEGALVSLAQTDSEGRYRLEGIPPGRYYIQAGLVDFPTYYPGVSNTAGARSIQITAGSLVESLDFTLAVSSGVRVSGRFPLNVARPIQLRLAGGSRGFQGNTAQIKPDGTFEFVRVPPGNYTLSALPNSGLPNLTIAVSDKDVEVGLPSGPGVKVTGVVGLGLRSMRPAGQRVVFSGSSGWAQVDAAVASDGKFELPSIPAGTYTFRTVPGSQTPHTTVVVADREISGVIVPAFVELTGIVALQDGQKLPTLSPALMIRAVRDKGATLATAIRPDGGFRFPLIEGDHQISLGNLPPGLSVKSITYGATDLLNAPLKLDGITELVPIHVTIEFAK